MFVKNRVMQLVIGCLALILAVFSALMLGKVIPSNVMPWAHAVLFICLFVNLIEVVIYFLFAKTKISLMVCRWINLFTICVMAVALTAGFAQAAAPIFTNFTLNAAIDLVLVLANYVLIAIIIVYLVFAKREQKEELRIAKGK